MGFFSSISHAISSTVSTIAGSIRSATSNIRHIDQFTSDQMVKEQEEFFKTVNAGKKLGSAISRGDIRESALSAVETYRDAREMHMGKAKIALALAGNPEMKARAEYNIQYQPTTPFIG